jgi:hypothetical protein
MYNSFWHNSQNKEHRLELKPTPRLNTKIAQKPAEISQNLIK